MRAIGFVGLGTLLAVVFTAQGYVSPSPQQLEWRYMLTLQLAFWYVWAALTPIAFVIAARTRIDTRGWFPRLGGWLALCLFLAAAHSALFMAARIIIDNLRGTPFHLGFPGAWWWYFKRSIAQDALDVALIAAAYQVLRADREARERRRVAEDLSTRLAVAELGLLRMQLQPHFLFNALNTVSSLMVHDPEAARSYLAEVGDLLRLALERLGRPEVRFSEELEFVERYLYLQRTRYGDRMRVQIDTEPAVEDAWVPSLILQPLVENAIRHGVEPRRGMVTVTLEARQYGDRMRIVVADTGPGLDNTRTSSGSGIGLRNTRQRLSQMYGSEGELSVSSGNGSGFVVTVLLPLRTTPALAQ